MRLSCGEMLKWILRRPVLVIFTTTVITFIFAWQLPNLAFKTSIYDLQIEDLPETVNYDNFKKLFGSDEIIRVVIKSDDVFDPVTFGKVEQLAESCAAIEGVRRVISLPGIKKAVDVSGDWSMEKFYAVVSRADLFRKNLISTDRKTTVLTLVLKNEADSATVIQRVNRMLAQAPKDLGLYQIGMPLVSEALARFTEKDFFRLPPITFLLIALILLYLFRKLQYILIPLVCIGLSLVWTFGLMAYLNIPLSMLTMIVPVFLIAVGTAYCLHIVSEYLAIIKEAESPFDATRKTFANISLPTLLAVLTTVIGLGSLLANRITAIQEFAIFSCFGMVSILIIVLTFLPAVLSFMPLPAKRAGNRIDTKPSFSSFIDKIVDINLNHQKIVWPIIGAVVLLSLIGIFRIQVETNPVGYLKEGSPVKRNFIDIYQDLSGSFPINIAMGGSQADLFENPKNLADIARFQEYLNTLTGVDKTLSFADYLKLVNYVLNRFEPDSYRLPEEGFEVRMLLNNFKTILGEDIFSRFMSADLSKTNILLLTHMSSSRKFLKLRQKTLMFFKQNFSKDLECEVTGLGMVIAASSHQLTIGQIKSLGITMILVCGIMFILFMSSKVGLIAMLPNLFPIIINFGIMGWLGIELSMVTSLIASIAIGLAVDDTIHYLVRYNREFKKDLDEKRAIRDTLHHVGKPIIFTTITLCAGFSILLFSSFKPTAIFGVMMVITSLSALIGDLILLPSLIRHIELVTLWDLLRLKLGAEPRMGIPLFKGLSRNQVHYILMAGSLKKIETGDILFQKGDVSDSMYTIISGTMDVYDPVSQDESGREFKSQILINQLKTGDALGEMGFLRSVPRSATVVATSPVELLQINWKMIKRLQWLYPPTAHKFFLNLMGVTCDRLENLTECFSEIKMLEDTKDLYSRLNFLKILDIEIQRSRNYCASLSLCILKIGLEEIESDLDNSAKDRIVGCVGNIFTEEIRDWDTLHRYDGQSYALLMPQTSIDEAHRLCNHLKRVSEECILKTEGVSAKFEFGWAELSLENDDTAADLLSRAFAELQNVN
ncbi:MAG: MMPL family transporter [Deltaproteobacteria bacterium]|nr:MMPL family transporter [Deltaproteobacteria bacterium]